MNKPNFCARLDGPGRPAAGRAPAPRRRNDQLVKLLCQRPGRALALFQISHCLRRRDRVTCVLPRAVSQLDQAGSHDNFKLTRNS